MIADSIFTWCVIQSVSMANHLCNFSDVWRLAHHDLRLNCHMDFLAY
uniref:Uncharacterized protein n=1 Tax=Arundo donax TaxID=35708 RepID=A0A0A9TK76_ARUDO